MQSSSRGFFVVVPAKSSVTSRSLGEAFARWVSRLLCATAKTQRLLRLGAGGEHNTCTRGRVAVGSVWAERDGKQVVRSVLSQACCRLVDTLAVVYQAFVSAFSSHNVYGRACIALNAARTRNTLGRTGRYTGIQIDR